MPTPHAPTPAPAPRPSRTGSNEEPEITQEESVPSDGKDTQGEKMMEELGRERDPRKQEAR